MDKMNFVEQIVSQDDAQFELPQALSDLQLALVGGGIGDTILV